MKVRCVRLLDSDGRDVDFSPWLTLGRVYPVLGISVGAEGQRSYQIVSHERDPGFATMAYYRAECFEVVSTVVPSNWRLKVRDDGGISVAPGSWQDPSFFEAFYDRDPDAYSIFVRERDLIVKEDP